MDSQWAKQKKRNEVTHRWKIRRWKLHKRRVHRKQKLRKCLVLSLSVIPFTIGDAIPNHQDIAWPVEDSVAMRRRHRNSNGVGSQLIYLYCWWPSHMSMTRVNNCTLVTCADPSKCWTPLISLCISSKDYRKPCQSCRLTNVKATISESKSYQRQFYQRQWFQQLHGNYQHIPTWQLDASYTGVKPRGATITLCHTHRK